MSHRLLFFRVFKFGCIQRSSIAADREFVAGQAPELKPIEKLNYKITTKSRTELRLLEPLLIANYSRLFQRPALFAAILLLPAVHYSLFKINLWFFNVLAKSKIDNIKNNVPAENENYAVSKYKSCFSKWNTKRLNKEFVINYFTLLNLLPFKMSYDKSNLSNHCNCSYLEN